MPRIMRRDRCWIIGLLGVSLILIGLGYARSARADRIMLRGGGQLHGKLIANPADPAHLTFVGALGRNPIIYKPEQILQVYPEKSDLDEYVIRRGRDRTLAEDEYQLAVWCEEHKYPDLALNHFEAAIRLDPQYAPRMKNSAMRWWMAAGSTPTSSAKHKGWSGTGAAG